MSKRNYDDWLQAYVDYASFSEAPTRMHFWAGVAAVAGALRRRVWINMGYFNWYPNHYIIFVAPPGVVSKSTTSAIAINILRKVPGINFGPDVVTWPALVTAFAAAGETFTYNEEMYTQCALTLESSEFGNLVNPQDRDMIDLLVTLWDSKTGAFKKVTKGSGNDTVENPWINMIACTTPSWIAGNFPEYVIGGGFTSRCLFVYADTKRQLRAYPRKHMPPDLRETEIKLTQDLEHIASDLVGPYQLSDDAESWGEEWYAAHDLSPPKDLANDDRFGGYLARKQTHIHKLAMVLAAASRSEMVITKDDLITADTMVSQLEESMQQVFSKIGRTEVSVQAEKLVKFIARNKVVDFGEAYRFVYTTFPNCRDFEEVVKGACRAGFIKLDAATGKLMSILWGFGYLFLIAERVPEIPQRGGSDPCTACCNCRQSAVSSSASSARAIS
jgi:hypothetical protein